VHAGRSLRSLDPFSVTIVLRVSNVCVPCTCLVDHRCVTVVLLHPLAATPLHTYMPIPLLHKGLLLLCCVCCMLQAMLCVTLCVTCFVTYTYEKPYMQQGISPDP
jgi:hypothetical protein